VLKVTNRTHVVDNSGGGSVFLDVEVGNAEGCWVLEGDEVEVRVGVRNGCRGLWVGSCCSGVSVVLLWEVDCWHDWEQTGPPRLQLIRRTKLHLGAHHETGEDKVETIELVCFDQVNEGRWTLSLFPPMHTLER
jgi:hypothetical protein